jgi:hypothetical protein
MRNNLKKEIFNIISLIFYSNTHRIQVRQTSLVKCGGSQIRGQLGKGTPRGKE